MKVHIDKLIHRKETTISYSDMHVTLLFVAKVEIFLFNEFVYLILTNKIMNVIIRTITCY